MPIEIEKKYRLSKKQREDVWLRLTEIGAKRKGEDFEVNTLYAGESLEVGDSVLRLRRIGKRGILTFKQRLPSEPGIKHQREEETPVDDPDAMELILDALGFWPAMIMKSGARRGRWGKQKLCSMNCPLACSWKSRELRTISARSKANSR